MGGAVAQPPDPVGQGGADDVLDGRRLCTSDAECAGLDCVRFGTIVEGACSKICVESADCVHGEICFGIEELPRFCAQPCLGAEDCGYGFDCVYYRDVATVCVAAAWTDVLMQDR